MPPSSPDKTDSRELVKLTATFGDTVQEVFAELLVKGYNREQELEADAMAAAYLDAAGYDRAALAGFLEQVASSVNASGGWFDTHPSPRDRIDELGGAAPDSATSSARRGVRRQRFELAMGR